ncbi:MAG TPA: CoA-disulfide reductase, partial [Sulfobacillus sp.]|nr:CoA-disulfide reductase [Sulfobacillus sp.]
MIATGSESVRPGIGGLELPGVFTLHTMADGFHVAQFMERHKPARALIIGAGYIGLEMAEALNRRGVEVIMVEQLVAILPTIDEGLAHHLRVYLEGKHVNVHTGVRVEKIERTAEGLIVYGDGGFLREVDMVLVVVGVKPVTGLAVNAGI